MLKQVLWPEPKSEVHCFEPYASFHFEYKHEKDLSS